MAAWFWINIPLCVVIFSAVVGIPLWMVFRHPDTEEDAAQVSARVRAMPLGAVSQDEANRWTRARDSYPTRMTSRLRGPCTPSTRDSSMSLVADGPLIQVSGRLAEGDSRPTASGTSSTTWSALTMHRW